MTRVAGPSRLPLPVNSIPLNPSVSPGLFVVRNVAGFPTHQEDGYDSDDDQAATVVGDDDDFEGRCVLHR